MKRVAICIISLFILVSFTATGYARGNTCSERTLKGSYLVKNEGGLAETLFVPLFDENGVPTGIVPKSFGFPFRQDQSMKLRTSEGWVFDGRGGFTGVAEENAAGSPEELIPIEGTYEVTKAMVGDLCRFDITMRRNHPNLEALRGILPQDVFEAFEALTVPARYVGYTSRRGNKFTGVFLNGPGIQVSSGTGERVSRKLQ